MRCVDDFVEFPGYPGLPERVPDLQAWPEFCSRMRERRFDLLIQLHGSGGVVNPLLRQLGAGRLAGFHDETAARQGFADQPANRLFVRWPDSGHEIVRLLQLTRHLGMADRGTELEFPLDDTDRQRIAQIWPGFADADAHADADARRRYVCVHPGSQLPSRRWPAERFAAVADGLAELGFTVVLTGTTAEKPLVESVARSMRSPSVDLAGRTSLWTLGALVERATFVVSNDTGISHIAAALRTPSVVVSCGADTSRWAPLDTVRHRVLAAPIACRPCAFAVCPYEHECATAVDVREVLAAVTDDAALERTIEEETLR
ncbi:MAG TPA: glycosyltransferase family 9 protein [Burkholderiaceae bacterium]|nr:glycosyltransferase family 9 protein [Burkholderiaceae bacterium]